MRWRGLSFLDRDDYIKGHQDCWFPWSDVPVSFCVCTSHLPGQLGGGRRRRNRNAPSCTNAP